MDRSKLDKLLRKKVKHRNHGQRNLSIVDHFIAKERNEESEIDCNTLLDTIINTENEVTGLGYSIQA